MDVSIGLLSAAISCAVSIGIALFNNHRQKAIQRMAIRPYLSVKMIVPPNDGIGGVPIKYQLFNLGNGIAFNPVITDVYRSIDGAVQEGASYVYPFDYDVVMKDSDIMFTVEWEHHNEISGATESEIMDILIKNWQESHRKTVVDNITIQFNDSNDSRYEQIATIEYIGPENPHHIREQISKPLLISCEY